jgi:hypothetical protein
MLQIRNRVFLLPAGLLLVALIPLPYGYYNFLRVVISAFAAWIIYIEYSANREMNGWAWTWVCVLALFNPIVPVHLNRFIWFFFNLSAAALFYFYAAQDRTAKPPVP